MRAIAAVDDVLFISRFQEVAAAQGARLSFAKGAEDCLSQLASQEDATLVIFDVNARSFDAVTLVEELVRTGWMGRVRVVGFVRHTDEDKIKTIREKGASEILARSAFVKLLPRLLSPKTTPQNFSPRSS